MKLHARSYSYSEAVYLGEISGPDGRVVKTTNSPQLFGDETRPQGELQILSKNNSSLGYLAITDYQELPVVAV